MGYRSDNYGRGQALQGDRTTTGAICLTSLPNCTEHGRGVIRVGDRTTRCPKCGKIGIIADGEPRVIWEGITSAVDCSLVICGCPPGANRVIAPVGQWLGQGPSPAQTAREKRLTMLAAQQAGKAAEKQRLAEEWDRNRVFVKSCLRGEGCNDAGWQREPHSNFAGMAFFQAAPAAAPDVPQQAQTGKKNHFTQDLTQPKKRSALYKWWFGHHEEMDYQAALAAATSVARVQTATAGASILEPIVGNIAVRGTWAVRAAGVAVGGVGAPLAGLLVGMMPGRLNDGEQDFIDRMRLEQMREAPTRARFTWENDSHGNPVPHGWHTPPGKDRVRVRKMAWNDTRQAYTFTTEEDNPVTIIWTPDSSGVRVPANTGNQTQPPLPNPVIVDPLPDNTGIESTTSPEPEEKAFADYILILPLPDIPPIYIYLNADHKYYAPPKGIPPLPAYPDAKKAQAKTPVKGGGKLRNRWKDSRGKIYEWDSQHGMVEVYDRSGRNHLGEFNHITGEQTKPSDPTRKVEK
ncbi:colicin E3/pyocin S6 family cytotoxin [Brenneria goodwinii]|uniref:colicin E3/pyocin S6 family cytotoxin n=1 Tax=Brenneria goodwinii TaxID=1109412 RepID=UPI0036E716C3